MSAVLSPLPVKPVCFSTAVPELANGIADFDTQSLTLHPSQSPPSLRQRPEQRSTSRSQSRSAASGSTPASLPAARLDDLPVSLANKKLGKAGGSARARVSEQVAAGHVLAASSLVGDRRSAEAHGR